MSFKLHGDFAVLCPRPEIRRLGCRLCTAGSGPCMTLGWRYSEKEGAEEDCWMALHFEPSTCHLPYALIFANSHSKLRVEEGPTGDPRRWVRARRSAWHQPRTWDWQ